jgi:hypothetical protein
MGDSGEGATKEHPVPPSQAEARQPGRTRGRLGSDRREVLSETKVRKDTSADPRKAGGSRSPCGRFAVVLRSFCGRTI